MSEQEQPAQVATSKDLPDDTDSMPIADVLADLRKRGVDVQTVGERVAYITGASRHQVRTNDDMKSPADWDQMLDLIEQTLFAKDQEVGSAMNALRAVEAERDAALDQYDQAKNHECKQQERAEAAEARITQLEAELAGVKAKLSVRANH